MLGAFSLILALVSEIVALSTVYFNSKLIVKFSGLPVLEVYGIDTLIATKSAGTILNWSLILVL